LYVLKARDKTPLEPRDLVAYLEVTYIFLDSDEKNQFIVSNFEQLASHVEQFKTDGKCASHKIDLDVKGSCIELIWVVRRRENWNLNRLFDFSGLDGRDPIQTAKLKFGNTVRFGGKEAKWYRCVQPYQHHNSIPKSYIYNYSFALCSGEPQPTGSQELGCIKNVTFHVELQEGLEHEVTELILYSRYWAVMSFWNGEVYVKR
jgi:hypothetical protein